MGTFWGGLIGFQVAKSTLKRWVSRALRFGFWDAIVEVVVVVCKKTIGRDGSTKA